MGSFTADIWHPDMCSDKCVFNKRGERQHWHQQVLIDAALDTQKLVIGTLTFILANLYILDL